jgi:hypothetical protein
MPLLWIPGLVGGLLASALWISLNITGAFFTSRLIVIAGLILFVFISGMLAVIKDDGGDLRSLLSGGIRYYFRVLLPQLVICFCFILIVVIVLITLSFIGIPQDVGLMTALGIGIVIPTLIFTFFFDTAAVFEDRRVFDAIRRSIGLVNLHFGRVISFFCVCAALVFLISFTLMKIWEAVLYDKLEPLTRFNETQIQSFSAEQLAGMIGPDGMWITAVLIFIWVAVLIPLLYSYKAFFFKKLAGSPRIIQQQVTGEYDSKGRWYKY